MSNGDQLELVGRLLLATLLGAAIGLEREFRGHEAGIRTSSLACLGAAIFGEISADLGDTRVAAGVVQGIGFLGAGLIFKREDTISGVTTAVTVWVLAGLGLMVASRFILASILLTVGVILLLELSPVSDWVYRHGRQHAGEPDAPKTEQGEPPGRVRH